MGTVAGIETSLMAGATIGLSIAAPFGPTSMLCVQRTLGDGLYCGLATGLGVATVHLAYGTLASLGASTFAAASQYAMMFSMLASLIMMAFSLRVLRSTVVLDPACSGRKAIIPAYFGAVGFGFLNPFTPLLFAAASPNLVSHDPSATTFLIAGVFMGSFAWWSVLSGGVSYFRSRVTIGFLRYSNKIAGLILGFMAIVMLSRACFAMM